MKELTKDQKKIAYQFGMSETELARDLTRNSSKTAIAASEHRRVGDGPPGLLRAHQEIDAAHRAFHSADYADNTSEPELVGAAISALKQWNPDKDDDVENYDHLLDAAHCVMRLVNRVGPDFAESKTEDRRGKKK